MMQSVAHPTAVPVISHLQPSPEWLQRSVEEILEPNLPIIDAHHHFSEHWGGYFPEELLADGAGHRIESTVYVQCGWGYRDGGLVALQPVGETESVVAVTKAFNRNHQATRIAAGIVGYADLRLGEQVADVLAAQVDAGDGRFRGIRNSGAFHPTFQHGVLPRAMEHLYTDPAFRLGYAQLSKFGLSFDAWVYHPQIREVLDLATAYPDIPLVLNHIGGVLGVADYEGRGGKARAEWLPWLRHLAECPNVFVKLGGLGTAVFGFDFARRPAPPSSHALADAWRPWFEPVIEAFGAQRCMFESNFPVDRSAAGYGVVWNAFKRIASGANEQEKSWLFKGTAAQVYRLNDESVRHL